jgi:hypothetical protein
MAQVLPFMWSRLITEDQRERKVTYADLFFQISPQLD